MSELSPSHYIVSSRAYLQHDQSFFKRASRWLVIDTLARLDFLVLDCFRMDVFLSFICIKLGWERQVCLDDPWNESFSLKYG